VLFDEEKKELGKNERERERERERELRLERNWIFSSDDFLYNEALFIHALKFLSHK